MDARIFKTSIKAKILIGFGSAIVVLVLAGIISFQSIQDLVRSLDFLSKPDVKLVKLNNVLSDISLSESNIRSYFITNEKRYLRQYEFHSKKLEKNLDSLSQLINKSHIESEKIKRINSLWNEKKKHTQDLIKLYAKKQERKLPDGILKKLNEENPDLPTVIITKTITIKNIEVPYRVPVTQTNNYTEDEKRSLLSKLFRKKDKKEIQQDSIILKPITTVMEEKTILVDTIYTIGQANEVKEEAFTRILTNIRRHNSKSKNELKESEKQIIQKDIGLIEYIRNIVIELKNAEQTITEANVREAKEIVEVSIVKIFLFGVSGISAILIFGFMIMNDVTKTNYHRNQLLNAKVQAEELVKAKESFLATMSHEIRTPLNAIVGFTEQLSKTRLLNRQKYFLQAVSDSTEHLLSLVNDILDHSSIEAGKLQFESTPFSLKDIIEEVYDTFYIKAEEKQLSLAYEIKGEDQIITGDPLRFKQILFNLVSNAVKFTENGSVSICCEQLSINDHEVIVFIKVLDTGIGIPSNKIDYIFDTFSQADSSITRKFGGTGLGLAISKKLVDLQGGKISVISNEGNGSEFAFNLKFQKWPYDLPVKTCSKIPEYGLLSGMKILIVEDDEFNLLLFHTILIKWNVRVQMVSTGEEALQILSKETFDLIVTDIQIPGMSGVDLFKAVNAHPDKIISETPVLAVTANVIKESMKAFKDSGFTDILLKPFKEEQLANAILKATGFEKETIETFVDIPAAECNDQMIFSDFIKFSGGNSKAMHTMINAFTANSNLLLENLKASFQEKDWIRLKETAHKLIPGFGHLHNSEITRLLSELENYLHYKRRPDETKTEKMVREILEKAHSLIRMVEEERLKML